MSIQISKGLIALDIDGTITAEAHTIDHHVVEYFTSLYHQGWSFLFVTGRPFQWGSRSLRTLSFPYLLSVQNGAVTLEMPSSISIDRRYISSKHFTEMDRICHKFETDYIVYSGWENRDYCYFRPKKLSRDLSTYLSERCHAILEHWEAVDDFLDLPVDTVAALKCFAKENIAFDLGEAIEKNTGLHAPVIRDPFSFDYFVVQATHSEATKGAIVSRLKKNLPVGTKIIAAGDDLNDISLLEVADIKIAMESAPNKLKEMAHIIAPPATDNGIIEGLQLAISQL